MNSPVRLDGLEGPIAAEALAFECHREVRAIEIEWRIFERRAAGHVFAVYDFVQPWVELVAPTLGIAPRIVVGRSAEGRVVCVLPFGLRRAAGLRILEWLGGPHADYKGGLFDPALLAALGKPSAAASFRRRALAAAGRADAARLERQPELIGEWPNPFASGTRQRNPEDAFHTVLGADWEAYYTGKRSQSSRRTDRRKMKKLEETGAVRFVVAQTAEEACPILTKLFEQKRRSLGAMGVPDIFATEAVRAFYDAVALRPYPDGPGHLCALMAGEEIVATNWGLVRGDRYYYVMHAYADGEIERTSPGKHLMYRLMQWCIAHGVGVYDFTIGNEDYKGMWCERSEALYTASPGLSLAGMVPAAAYRSADAAKRFVKTSPTLLKAVQFARRRIAGKPAPVPAREESE
ncbi:MAG: GNAT family N-acetyltransferase [Bauldia sp.]|nr:GNAT family N-acetyltransferase [Bauldia sp.]